MRSREPRSPRQRADNGPFQTPGPDDDLPLEWNRPLGLRLLALLGALSFVMIGVSVVAPLLQQRPPLPRPLPGNGQTATS
ncbi:MAG: hypothetical protein ACKO0M_02725 [Cyanobium sp.]